MMSDCIIYEGRSLHKEDNMVVRWVNEMQDFLTGDRRLTPM